MRIHCRRSQKTRDQSMEEPCHLWLSKRRRHWNLHHHSPYKAPHRHDNPWICTAFRIWMEHTPPRSNMGLGDTFAPPPESDPHGGRKRRTTHGIHLVEHRTSPHPPSSGGSNAKHNEGSRGP